MKMRKAKESEPWIETINGKQVLKVAIAYEVRINKKWYFLVKHKIKKELN